MTSLFISYSRRDIELARRLTDAFEGQGLDFWIDWEGIPPTVDWWQEVERGIEAADVFLFLLSPDSCKSKICGQEIEHAVLNGKRLIPIVVRDVQPEETPASLSHLNWIFLRETDDFTPAFNKLITAIKTDYDWVQVHRELQVKALEWERSGHDPSLFLRGRELQSAEQQLAANASKEPFPTDLQRDYVLKSRQASDRQRRTTMGIAVAGVITLALLAIYGFVQAGRATTNANVAEAASTMAIANASTAQAASTLAFDNAATAQANAIQAEYEARMAQSMAWRDRNLALSLLLGVEAFRHEDTPQSRGLLLDNVQYNPQLLQFLRGHSGGVNSVAFSSDGQLLGSGSADGTVILWDVKTRQPVGNPLAGHNGSIHSLAFSPDNKLLASGGEDKTIILWDVSMLLDAGVATRQPVGSPLHTPDTVNSLAFSPKCASPPERCRKLLASGNADGTITIWDMATFQPVGQPLKMSAAVNMIAFSPNGNLLAAASDDRTIVLWDTATFEPIGQPLRGHLGAVYSLAFSPDGKTLASGSSDTNILLWDVSTEQPIAQPLRGHYSRVNSLAFSPDGKTLASGSGDQTIILWDVTSRQRIGLPLRGHSALLNSLAFSPDGKLLASGSLDRTVILWDMAAQQRIDKTIIGRAGSVNSLAFSPDGKILASGTYNNTVTLWDVSTLLNAGVSRLLTTNGNTDEPSGKVLTGHTAQIRSVSFSPDGKLLASGSDDQTIILWDVSTYQPIGSPLTGQSGPVYSVAFSPDGTILASGSADGTVIIWNVDTHEPIGAPLAGHAGPIYGVAFSPDGQLLASGSADKTILLWDVNTHEPLAPPLTGHTDQVRSLAFSPDGKLLASSSLDHTVILWDLATFQPVGPPLTGASTLISSLSFSPDGKMLAAGMYDKNILLWDVGTQQPIGQPLEGHLGSVYTVAFSPQCSRSSPGGSTKGCSYLLASGGLDNNIILWDLDPQSWLDKACQRAGRNFTQMEWTQYFPDQDYRKTCDQWPLDQELSRLATPAP